MGGAEPLPDDGDYSKMSFVGLFFMGFFWVCGGPYGGEGLIQLAPTGVIFSVYLASQFLYAMPIALINAELAVAIPEDGGIVVWTQRAFGPIVGGHNSWWCYVSYCFDSTIYPLLAATYILIALRIEPEDERHRIIELGIAEGIVVSITLLKLLGNDVLLKFIEVATVVSLGPIVVFLVWGAATVRMRPERWAQWEFPDLGSSLSDAADGSIGSAGGGPAAGDIQWKLLISWVIWLNSGFLAVGALAAGVADPRRSFPLLVATLVPFIFLVNASPFLISLCVDEDRSNYESGHFSVLAEEVAGVWLRHCLLVGAVTCTVALYANCIIIPEITMQFAVQEHFPSRSKIDGSVLDPSDKSVAWLWRHPDGAVAPAYVLFNGALASVLVLLPYRVLIEFAITTIAMPTLFFLGSFLVLRWREPEIQEKFRACPGGRGKLGFCLAVCLALPPAALTVLQVGLALSDEGVDVDGTRGGGGDQGGASIGGWKIPMPALLAQLAVFALGSIGHLIGWW